MRPKRCIPDAHVPDLTGEVARRGICSRGHTVSGRLLFQLGAPGDPGALCLWHAVVCPRLLRRSVLMALAVGTVCTAINQGWAFLSRQLDISLAWKVPLTYVVPFCVAMTVTLLGGRRQLASGWIGRPSAEE